MYVCESKDEERGNRLKALTFDQILEVVFLVSFVLLSCPDGASGISSAQDV